MDNRVKLRPKLVTGLVLSGLLMHPITAGANNKQQSPSRTVVKVLSDHPGGTTALTPQQKSEIKKILAKGKGNRYFICTGTSLSGQRESMYPIVLLRAQLVCEYAKSLDPSIETAVKEKTITSIRLNGRVEVISK
jgi:hypothetical protein